MKISGQHLVHPIFLTLLIFILLGVLSTGCPPKVVRVTVSEEDMVRANNAANEADIAFARKDYYAALIKYLEAVQWNPNSNVYFNRLGITYSLLQFYDQAETAFQRSIILNSKFPYAFNNLGSVFFAQRNYKKAEKNFKKAIHLKKDEASFHMNLGSLYLEKKKYDKAMAEWRKGLTLDPDVFDKTSSVSLTGSGRRQSPMERYFLLARIFASKGNAESAVKNLKLALTHGFKDINAIKYEPDFKPIQQDPDFIEFMKNAPLLIKLRANVGLPENTSSAAPTN